VDVGIEEVDAHERQIRRGNGGLLPEPDDPTVRIDLRDPEAGRVGHLCEKENTREKKKKW
jgi:hypothetical protein